MIRVQIARPAKQPRPVPLDLRTPSGKVLRY